MYDRDQEDASTHRQACAGSPGQARVSGRSIHTLLVYYRRLADAEPVPHRENDQEEQYCAHEAVQKPDYMHGVRDSMSSLPASLAELTERHRRRIGLPPSLQTPSA